MVNTFNGWLEMLTNLLQICLQEVMLLIKSNISVTVAQLFSKIVKLTTF